MTMQETFNRIVTHLRKQGCKSIAPPLALGPNQPATCMYRYNGLACAAGCLIPDEDYSPRLENISAHHSPVSDILRKYGHDIPLVARMQYVHDSYEVDKWEEGFRDVAKRFGLEVPPKQSS